MSAGGGFSTIFAHTFSAKAAITYCASGAPALMDLTEVPTLFCMAPADSVIGAEGNNDALNNFNTLTVRNICTKHNMNQKYPIYPKYFMKAGLSESESIDVYNEMIDNDVLLSNKIPAISADELQNNVQSTPASWSNLLSHTTTELIQIKNLFGIHYGDHKFYSNHNMRSLRFFNNLCDITTDRNFSINPELIPTIYPNPTTDKLNVKNENSENFTILLYNMYGELLLYYKNQKTIDVSNLSTGMYIISILTTDKKYIHKFIKN